MQITEIFEATTFKATSGQWSWSLLRDGVQISGGAGYASLDEAEEVVTDLVSGYVGERDVFASYGWSDAAGAGSTWVEEVFLENVVL